MNIRLYFNIRFEEIYFPKIFRLGSILSLSGFYSVSNIYEEESY